MIPLIPIGIGLGLLAHHYWKHKELKGWRRIVQWKDIDNHETFALFCFGAALGGFLL